MLDPNGRYKCMVKSTIVDINTLLDIEYEHAIYNYHHDLVLQGHSQKQPLIERLAMSLSSVPFT